MVQMLFPQIQRAPGPDFIKVGKSHYDVFMSLKIVFISANSADP